MTTLDILEDNTSIAYPDWKIGTTDTCADARQAERLVHAVAGEISGMAGLVAAAASVVNALANAGASRTREASLLPHMPPEPVLYPKIVERLALAELPPGVFDTIQRFYSRLRHVRGITLAFASCDADLVFKGGVHIEVLAGAWCGLCEDTIDVMELLGDTSKTCHAASPSVDVAGCGKKLARAASGGWPCVKPDGSIEVPGLAERRSQMRHPVSWPARMLLHGSMAAVRIENVSEGGFGMSCDTRPAVGEQIVVELMDRLLTGLITWSAGRRCGIKLTVPLPPGDAIISAARGR